MTAGPRWAGMIMDGMAWLQVVSGEGNAAEGGRAPGGGEQTQGSAC